MSDGPVGLPTEADVVVVGYGPVGQVVAALLGRCGHRVVVLERRPALYGLPRAGHFDHEVMAIFRALGIGDDVAAISAPARTYHMVDADGDLIGEIERPGESPSGGPWSYHFYQPFLEDILDAKARSEPTVSVHLGWQVDAVHDRPDAALVTARDRSSGTTALVTARYVIGADGANSRVRRVIGSLPEDLGFHADWLVVDIELADPHSLEGFADTTQICDPARPAYVGLLGGRYARWEFMLLEGEDRAAIESTESIWRLLAPWIPPGRDRVIRSAVYTFDSVIEKPWRRGRTLLAGDAAHRMPPFLGQGMCSGVRDAATLTWMLDLVLRGQAEPRLLDSYELTRAEQVRQYIEASISVGQTVCITDPEEAALAASRMRSAPSSVSPPLMPRVGPALIRPGDPLAGMLAPHTAPLQPVRAHTDSLVGHHDRSRPGFTLVSAGYRGLAQLDRNGLDLTTRLPIDCLDITATSDPDLACWLRDGTATSALIRPDGYVYGTAPRGDALPVLLADLAADLALC